jgi:ketosteroid isomerase-like protein
VSQENVGNARRFYEALNRLWAEGVFPFDLFDPAVEFDFSRRLIDPATHRGLDEARRSIDEARAIYSGVEYVLEDLLAAREKVVAMVLIRGEGASSGAAVEARVATVLTFRDGKLLRLEYFGDRGEALRAVGLEE